MRGADSDSGRSDRPTLSDPPLRRFPGSEITGDITISEISDPVSDPDRPFRPSRNGPTDRPSLGDPEDDECKINFAPPELQVQLPASSQATVSRGARVSVGLGPVSWGQSFSSTL